MEDKNIWWKLWNIKAPPKTLNVVWRALSYCLPTLVQLHHKHVPVQVVCPVCANGRETIYHSLVGCYFVGQCWRVFNVNIQIEEEMDFSG